MSFEYTTGDPDNLVAGDSAQMIDIQGPFVDLAAYLNSPIPLSQPPVVTSLPSSPVEGQECIYHPAVTRKNGATLMNDAYWHMRYISGVWRFLGGAPYVAAIPGVFATTLGGAFVSMKTRITIPAVGDWRVRSSVRLHNPSVATQFTLLTGISDNSGNGTEWTDVGSAPMTSTSGAGGSCSGEAYFRVASLAVPNFESWVLAPASLTVTVSYGLIAIEPVAL